MKRKRMLAICGMVVLAFAVILVAAPAMAQRTWEGTSSASGWTETFGNHSSGSWSSGCGNYCGGHNSGISAYNNTGNAAGVEGYGREKEVDQVRYEAEAKSKTSYSNNARSRNGSIRTSGTGVVKTKVSGKSR